MKYKDITPKQDNPEELNETKVLKLLEKIKSLPEPIKGSYTENIQGLLNFIHMDSTSNIPLTILTKAQEEVDYVNENALGFLKLEFNKRKSNFLKKVLEEE